MAQAVLAAVAKSSPATDVPATVARDDAVTAASSLCHEGTLHKLRHNSCLQGMTEVLHQFQGHTQDAVLLGQ